MANHLTDEAFAGSTTLVALVAAGRDTSRKQRRKRMTRYRCQKKGHLTSECMVLRPLAEYADASAAIAV